MTARIMVSEELVPLMVDYCRGIHVTKILLYAMLYNQRRGIVGDVAFDFLSLLESVPAFSRAQLI